MGNCIVKKLSTKVENSDLEIFGKIKMYIADTTEKTGNKVILSLNTGDGYMTWNESELTIKSTAFGTTLNSPKKVNLTHDNGNFLSESGSGYIYVDKYELTKVYTDNPYPTKFVDSTIVFKESVKLDQLSIFNQPEILVPVNSFAKLINLADLKIHSNSIDLTGEYVNNINGFVNKIAELQVANGRTSGNLVIKINGTSVVTKTITFDTSDNGYTIA